MFLDLAVVIVAVVKLPELNRSRQMFAYLWLKALASFLVTD